MRLIHNKAFAIAYWLVAFIATVLGIVLGAKASNGSAPEFGDGSGTSVGSHVLFSIGGGVLGGLVVAALFAGAWIALWIADRRANPAFDDDDDYGTFDDFDAEHDDDDAPEHEHGGEGVEHETHVSGPRGESVSSQR